jgi:hypothetical protein
MGEEVVDEDEGADDDDVFAGEDDGELYSSPEE